MWREKRNKRRKKEKATKGGALSAAIELSMADGSSLSRLWRAHKSWLYLGTETSPTYLSRLPSRLVLGVLNTPNRME